MSLVDPRRDPPPEYSGRSGAVTDPTCRDVIELLLDYLEEALDPGRSPNSSVTSRTARRASPICGRTTGADDSSVT